LEQNVPPVSENSTRVLLINTWYPADAARRSLFHELVDALRDEGAAVDVIALDWRDIDQTPGALRYQEETNYRVYRFNPVNFEFFGNKVKLALKWALSSWKPVPRTLWLLKSNKYDHVIVHAPSPLYMTVLISVMLTKARKYLIQWDFFPYSEIAIGLLNSSFSFRTSRALETFLIQKFNVIGCMSNANINFLRKNYRLRRAQIVELLPIWGDPSPIQLGNREELRKKYDLPLSSRIAVFGGTLARGRGVDDIIEAAKIAALLDPDLYFLIVGTGPLEQQYREAVLGASNIRVLNYIPRSDYQIFLTACDCGIVATQRNTGLPTFPSKTIDYFRAGIPVIASVEVTTDYGSMLESRGAGIAVAAGNCQELAATISRVTSDNNLKDQLSANARILLKEYFSVSLIAKKIIGKV
jgi:glycosyltransferase involved in cell wall biosynthesis